MWTGGGDGSWTRAAWKRSGSKDGWDKGTNGNAITQSGLSSREKTATISCELQVAKLTDQDNIEVFQVTFERLMEVYEAQKTCWA